MPSKVTANDATESKNSFAGIDVDTDTPTEAPAKKSWAEMSEAPSVSSMTETLAKALDEGCSGFAESMEFLAQVVTSVITTKARELIEQERVGLDTDSQTEMVSRIHQLTNECKKYTSSVAESVAAVTSVMDELNKKKADILSQMERFVRQMSAAESGPVVVPVVPVAQRPVEVLTRQQRPASYASTVRVDSTATPGLSTMTTKVGLVDVTAPVTTSAANVPAMSIRFSPSHGVFLINLDGGVYSFGAGTFVSRNGKTVAMYGKRCNSKDGCDEATCTYYHDPLKFANGHITRNMSINYIVEDLIKGVASDEEIVANAFSRNPFIVEDLVQLAGMLLLKSLAVKQVVKNSRRSSEAGRSHRSH